MSHISSQTLLGGAVVVVVVVVFVAMTQREKNIHLKFKAGRINSSPCEKCKSESGV